jgi:acyl-CoA synthetase (AMP-forming)/AMP-acid ligase II
MAGPPRLTIGAAFLAAAARVPRRVAIRFEGRDITYAELEHDSGRVAAGLLARGLRAGERVGVLMPNRPEFVVAILGIARAGLVAVPIPASATEREQAHIASDAGLRAVVHAGGEAATGIPHVTVARLLEAVSGGVGDLAGESTPFFIGYTSGTTGRPKGAVVSHRARTLLGLLYGQEYGCYTPGETHLITTPMYHGAGLSRALVPLLSGAAIELLPRFDAERAVDAFASGRVTATFMVPTMFASIFELPEPRIPSGPIALRTILSNASALPEHLKRRTLEQWPEVRLFEIYGSTEAGTVTSLRPEDQLRKQRCVGLPLPLTEVRVVDGEGRDVEGGAVGRLFSRSPFQFDGYHENPAATAEVMLDGYMTSGDLARRDEEAYVYIVGRTSDLIISGGVNVYPREVEEYLAEMPAVREAVVLGVPDQRWGEAVHAVLVTQPGMARPTEAELAEHCRRGLAPAKIPKSFAFRDSLPRTPSGKVIKRELIQGEER